MKIDVTGLDKYEHDVRDVISDLVDDEDVVSQETKTFVDGTKRYMDRFVKQIREAGSRVSDWNGVSA